jgi:N-acetylglucosaminyl-diphospho-decaprenol L-rhamnosyltransferase
VFVNPDARLKRGATAALVGALVESDGVGAVGARVDGPGGPTGAAAAGFEPSLRSIAGHFLFFGRIPGLRGAFRPLQLPGTSAERAPDWVSGAAMLVRRSAFQQVGGFDERLFLYMEDVDLCRRLRERGWTIRYAPEAVVDHTLGGSQGADQAERWYRALHAYLVLHRGMREARIASAVAAIGLALRVLRPGRRARAQARRMARAATSAAGLAFGIDDPE